MPDTKITALTALTAADPANDVLPIVDVSDTTMAASGTTKKISINNVLGCSGTATLASATITGNLTVDTNTLFVDSATNNVSIGGLVNKVTGVSGSGTGLTIQASAAPTLGIWDTSDPSYFTNLTQVDANLYLYNNAAGSVLFGVANAEAMRLNSTGLGVGVTPTLEKLQVNGGIVLSPPATPATLTTNGQLTVNATSNTNLRFSYRGSDGTTRTADITLA